METRSPPRPLSLLLLVSVSVPVLRALGPRARGLLLCLVLAWASGAAAVWAAPLPEPLVEARFVDACTATPSGTHGAWCVVARSGLCCAVWDRLEDRLWDAVGGRWVPVGPHGGRPPLWRRYQAWHPDAAPPQDAAPEAVAPLSELVVGPADESVGGVWVAPARLAAWAPGASPWVLVHSEHTGGSAQAWVAPGALWLRAPGPQTSAVVRGHGRCLWVYAPSGEARHVGWCASLLVRRLALGEGAGLRIRALVRVERLVAGHADTQRWEVALAAEDSLLLARDMVCQQPGGLGDAVHQAWEHVHAWLGGRVWLWPRGPSRAAVVVLPAGERRETLLRYQVTAGSATVAGPRSSALGSGQAALPAAALVLPTGHAALALAQECGELPGAANCTAAQTQGCAAWEAAWRRVGPGAAPTAGPGLARVLGSGGALGVSRPVAGRSEPYVAVDRPGARWGDGAPSCRPHALQDMLEAHGAWEAYADEPPLCTSTPPAEVLRRGFVGHAASAERQLFGVGPGGPAAVGACPSDEQAWLLEPAGCVACPALLRGVAGDNTTSPVCTGPLASSPPAPRGTDASLAAAAPGWRPGRWAVLPAAERTEPGAPAAPAVAALPALAPAGAARLAEALADAEARSVVAAYAGSVNLALFFNMLLVGGVVAGVMLVVLYVGQLCCCQILPLYALCDYALLVYAARSTLLVLAYAVPREADEERIGRYTSHRATAHPEGPPPLGTVCDVHRDDALRCHTPLAPLYAAARRHGLLEPRASRGPLPRLRALLRFLGRLAVRPSTWPVYLDAAVDSLQGHLDWVSRETHAFSDRSVAVGDGPSADEPRPPAHDPSGSDTDSDGDGASASAASPLTAPRRRRQQRRLRPAGAAVGEARRAGREAVAHMRPLGQRLWTLAASAWRVLRETVALTGRQLAMAMPLVRYVWVRPSPNPRVRAKEAAQRLCLSRFCALWCSFVFYACLLSLALSIVPVLSTDARLRRRVDEAPLDAAPGAEPWLNTSTAHALVGSVLASAPGWRTALGRPLALCGPEACCAAQAGCVGRPVPAAAAAAVSPLWGPVAAAYETSSLLAPLRRHAGRPESLALDLAPWLPAPWPEPLLPALPDGGPGPGPLCYTLELLLRPVDYQRCAVGAFVRYSSALGSLSLLGNFFVFQPGACAALPDVPRNTTLVQAAAVTVRAAPEAPPPGYACVSLRLFVLPARLRITENPGDLVLGLGNALYTTFFALFFLARLLL